MTGFNQLAQSTPENNQGYKIVALIPKDWENDSMYAIGEKQYQNGTYAYCVWSMFKSRPGEFAHGHYDFPTYGDALKFVCEALLEMYEN